MNQYVEEKNGDFFVLPDDNDFADVIFLYHSINDPLIATCHYLVAGEKSGYYFCCGDGCPACMPGPGREKGIWRNDKLFIPLYNITNSRIEVWDRSARFRDQLVRDVFKKYPDPSEYVFRITRHGQARDVNTTYSIDVVGTNSSTTIEAILASQNTTLETIYNNTCKEITPFEMKLLLEENNTTAANNTAAAYGAMPRATFTPPGQITPPDVPVETPTISMPTQFAGPTDIPNISVPTVPEVEPVLEQQVEVPVITEIPEVAESTEEAPDLGDLGDVKF